MKYWYGNLILVILSLLSVNAAFLFSVFILLTAVLQLIMIPALLKHRRQRSSGYKTMLVCYGIVVALSVLVYSLAVYYLNVKPSLFNSFDSTERALLFFQRLLIIPALLHLLLHRSHAVSIQQKPNLI
jgi:hypothetical protein